MAPVALALALLAYQPAEARGAERELKVLTLNVFAGRREMDFERLTLQIRKVRALDPDVICLQELYDDQARSLYKHGFPGLQYGYAELGVGTSPGLLESAVDRWVAKTPGERRLLEGDAFGLLTLLKRSSGRVFDFSERAIQYEIQEGNGLDTAIVNALKPKGFVAIDYDLGAETVQVVNTHMTNGAVAADGVHNPYRIRQARQLAEFAMHRGKDAAPHNLHPVIACGDTNADGEEPDMRAMRRWGFRDTYLENHPDPRLAPHGGMTWDNANSLTAGNLREPDQRVDFVYYLPGELYTFETVDSRIVFDEPPFVTDHYAVLSTLKLIRRKDVPPAP